MDTCAYKKHRCPQNRFKTAFLVLKLAFFVLGFISFIKFGVPLLQQFLFQTIPSLWLSFSSWLTPHFLYIILNCIILTLAVTSSLHHNPKSEGDEYHDHGKEQHPHAPEISYHLYEKPHSCSAFHDENPTTYALVPGETLVSGETLSLSNRPTKAENDSEDFNYIVRSNWTAAPEQRSTSSCITTFEDWTEVPEQRSTTCITIAEDKPLASARFSHKKFSKASPEIKTSPLSRVSRPKKGETLECTWRTITEGRHPPLARHLRKSETWETSTKTINADISSSPALRKSQTVRDRCMEESPGSSASASPARHSMKREPSPSQDELNRRVEAFISKFNNEIRLQRQNSFKSYTDMINRM